jgi:hypothetical protein
MEGLLSRLWAPPDDDHPLAALQGQRLGDHRLVLLFGPKNNVGSRYFQLLLVDGGGRLSDAALAMGLHNSGPYPGFNWVELATYDAWPAFHGKIADLAAEGLDIRLFDLLSGLVPPGGHVMVEYESPSQRDTERIVTLGYPPATSPLGYLMFLAGCRSYRDWYISEGGREGPRKLQGFKPLNEAIALEKIAALRRELMSLLKRPEEPRHGEWGRTARRLAGVVLEGLEAGSARR